MKKICGAPLAIVTLAFLAACGGGTVGLTPSQQTPLAPFASQPQAVADDSYAAGVKDVPSFRDLGHAPRSLQVQLSVVLRYQHEPELDALVYAQSERSSPYFRRFLTNTQFNAYFAPSIETYRRVTGALTAGGLTIVKTFPNRTVIEARGSSAAVERLFQTQMDQKSRQVTGDAI